VTRPRLVVALTGSSAPHLGVRLLRELRALGEVETHCIVSDGARLTIELEMGMDPDEVTRLADVVHAPDDFSASVASGSFETIGMVVIPCSMGTLGAIAAGTTPNLVARVADVALKERRRLVLVTRETPLSLVHIRNMETVTLAGAIVLPPVPAFYHRPRSIDDLLAHTVGKVLDQFAIRHDLFTRWS
jgi:4-hydroxy-3-polyprenylbenzoate decarboxylase